MVLPVSACPAPGGGLGIATGPPGGSCTCPVPSGGTEAGGTGTVGAPCPGCGVRPEGTPPTKPGGWAGCGGRGGGAGCGGGLPCGQSALAVAGWG
ncbi:hypothetical protein Sgou_55360 [Streptomyces gougerotii]|uniref:Uncharacterized protein n=2 Tax=Streptomyces diastaticus group TaxID=2849069 RepID=A0A8H9HQN1_9ACTN|nr:hypothetical protein Srut_32950 [Streptomyces rutgersensis]GFH72068.1 hypothetical protein Sdia_28360 [Streptomyces diastaticus subsp. diastaticus]GFH80866.1 hypothetical protein Sgou_55360 [Streptomyces gougerotii]GGU30228.1 hypothetical protein GCM10015534_35980 [Streptomyces diastaticus subsp. diastaticus]GGU79264.1 hypothetical protein GCM10010227_36730 [Streptomyces gougerotii]